MKSLERILPLILAAIPLGCSGARIITTLIYALKRRGGKLGLASLCIGGGEATAIIIKNEA